MNYSRKEFIKLGGGLAAAVGISPILSKCLPAEESKKIKTFGIQLWSVREILAKDTRNVLKQLASFGYKQVESFDNNPAGIYWGMKPVEFKNYLSDIGMSMLSTHLVIEQDFEKKLADAVSAGVKYVIFQWEEPGTTLDDYKKFADEFNKKGELCKKSGIRFAYHNHAHSFEKIKGEYPQDILMQGTDPALVDFQMDIHWVKATGNDPETWLNKYPGRFRLCHIKDLDKKGKSCILGEGNIDFPKILHTARLQGMQYYLAEQEDYDSRDSVRSAELNAAYLKKIRI